MFISRYVSGGRIINIEVLFSMLDFAAQKKLLDPLLKHPRNHFCADCDSISPTCTFPLIQGPLSTSASFSAEIAQALTER